MLNIKLAFLTFSSSYGVFYGFRLMNQYFHRTSFNDREIAELGVNLNNFRCCKNAQLCFIFILRTLKCINNLMKSSFLTRKFVMLKAES